MRLLYIFPHPDDESFGPAAAMARQRRAGHEVHLLTLTRGGATKRRHELGLSVEEMGAVRHREMERVAETLDLSGMTVLDLPDSGLAELDPRVIERAVAGEVRRIEPAVVVTYPVHGISGFFDHLVTHAVVKRAYCRLRDDGAGFLSRLAFHTLSQIPDGDRPFRLTASSAAAIDVVCEVDDGDLAAQRAALACYETYRETIEKVDPMSVTGRRICFELFQEEHDPPLPELTAGL